MTHTANAGNPAVTSFKVHPLGFSAFEKSTIETFFRLAARRAPFWSVTPLIDEATVLLLNAATSQDYLALARKMSRSQRAVIVGASDFGTGWPVIARPLKLTALLTSLSVYVQDGGPAAPAAAAHSARAPLPARDHALTSTSHYSSGFVPLHAPDSAVAPLSAVGVIVSPVSPVSLLPGAPSTFSVPLAASPRSSTSPPARPAERVVELSTSAFGSPSTQRSSAVSAVIAARNVLIVDDSDIALKFMQSRLRHFGYESKLARSGEEALTMTAKDDYQFVFMDVMMAGLDGYQTCRAIKQNKGKRPTIPVVVMLTSRGGTIDKIRGSMSGCDAYLTKPLNEQQLGMVLAQHAATSIKRAAPAQAATRPAGSLAVATYVSRPPSRVPASARP